MHQSDVQDGGFMAFQHNVAIRHMRIVPKQVVEKILQEEMTAEDETDSSSGDEIDLDIETSF